MDQESLVHLKPTLVDVRRRSVRNLRVSTWTAGTKTTGRELSRTRPNASPGADACGRLETPHDQSTAVRPFAHRRRRGHSLQVQASTDTSGFAYATATSSTDVASPKGAGGSSGATPKESWVDHSVPIPAVPASGSLAAI